MRRFIFLFVIWGVAAPCVADSGLPTGVKELRATVFGKTEVVVRAEVGVPKASDCMGWRWGAESECPKTALVNVVIKVGGEEIFVPRSAFADLGTPSRINLKSSASSVNVIVAGGDAATAYTATLIFSRTELKRRKVFGKEFKQTAWEDTTYSFPR
jgi:hypothetical protein